MILNFAKLKPSCLFIAPLSLLLIMSIKRDSYDSYDSYRVGYLFRKGATKKNEKKNEFQTMKGNEYFYYFAIVILSFKRN